MVSLLNDYNILTAIPVAQQVVGLKSALTCSLACIAKSAKCAFTKYSMNVLKKAEAKSELIIDGEFKSPRLEKKEKEYAKLKGEIVENLKGFVDGVLRAIPVVGTCYSLYQFHTNVVKLPSPLEDDIKLEPGKATYVIPTPTNDRIRKKYGLD